jgi:phosphatidylinositol glycan class M
VGALVLAEGKRWRWAAVVFGIAVHFKVFPVIYVSSILAAISPANSTMRLSWITRERVRVGLISSSGFLAINLICFAM